MEHGVLELLCGRVVGALERERPRRGPVEQGTARGERDDDLAPCRGRRAVLPQVGPVVLVGHADRSAVPVRVVRGVRVGVGPRARETPLEVAHDPHLGAGVLVVERDRLEREAERLSVHGQRHLGAWSVVDALDQGHVEAPVFSDRRLVESVLPAAGDGGDRDGRLGPRGADRAAVGAHDPTPEVAGLDAFGRGRRRGGSRAGARRRRGACLGLPGEVERAQSEAGEETRDRDACSDDGQEDLRVHGEDHSSMTRAAGPDDRAASSRASGPSRRRRAGRRGRCGCGTRPRPRALRSSAGGSALRDRSRGCGAGRSAST